MPQPKEIKQIRVDTRRLWLSNREAARYLGVSKDWLTDRRNEGQLSFSKVGNTIFYIKSEIDALIVSGAVTGVGKFRAAKAAQPVVISG